MACIGAAIAHLLAENGAGVAVTYKNSSGSAGAAVTSIAAAGRCDVAIQADSAVPEDIAKAMAEAVSALGRIDILVNSAAIGRVGSVVDIDIDAYRA